MYRYFLAEGLSVRAGDMWCIPLGLPASRLQRTGDPHTPEILTQSTVGHLTRMRRVVAVLLLPLLCDGALCGTAGYHAVMCMHRGCAGSLLRSVIQESARRTTVGMVRMGDGGPGGC